MKLIPKYKNPAQPISAIREDSDKKVSRKNRAIYSTFNPIWDTPPWYSAISKGVEATYKQITNPDEMNYTVTDSVADAGWRKRLGLSYNSKFLPNNKDGSVRLPKYVEDEIPTDTVMLKKRIKANQQLADSPQIMGKDWQLIQGMINLDQNTLESLRHTYKTGEPVVINEYSNNSRKLMKNGKLDKNYQSPLNILRNFTIQYNPKNNTMEYKDIYDFDGYEWAVPGKPFNIKGSIKLK